MAGDTTPSNPSSSRGPDAPPGAPRWVKISAIVGIVLVLLVVAMLVFGGGNHGPGRHTTASDVAQVEHSSGPHR